MRISWLNLIVCSLLALLFLVERAMPCIDECVERENDPCAEVLSAACDHPDDGASDVHHCDHCTCTCHIPAIKAQSTIEAPLHAEASPYGLYRHSLPASVVSKPDHIPLI